MNLLSWNCRGLGAPLAVHEMAKLVRKHNPQVLFLMETKRKSNEMEWLRAKWGFDNCLTVECIRRGGGLALLWLKLAQVEILSFSSMHIDARIGQDDNDKI